MIARAFYSLVVICSQLFNLANATQGAISPQNKNQNGNGETYRYNNRYWRSERRETEPRGPMCNIANWNCSLCALSSNNYSFWIFLCLFLLFVTSFVYVFGLVLSYFLFFCFFVLSGGHFQWQPLEWPCHRHELQLSFRITAKRRTIRVRSIYARWITWLTTIVLPVSGLTTLDVP